MTGEPARDDEAGLVERIARSARSASRVVARAASATRVAALHGMASALERDRARLLEENREDVAAATRAGTAAPLVDRLTLDRPRLDKMIAAVREVAAQPDPVGAIVRSWTRPNGLAVSRRRIPLGVILMIYEARPNVTSDAAALCLKAGNACILRGGSEALGTNRAIAASLARGLVEARLPAEAIQLVPTTSREAMKALLVREAEIDLCIPRGGEGLIRFVAEHARVPVIKHYTGNCHVYVERSADVAMALAICENAKAQRPGVCNAAETILVDEAIAERFLPLLVERLGRAGVELRGDERARAIVPAMARATDDDFATEFLALVCAVGVVRGVDAAIAHIERFGSSHTEAIVTSDEQAAARFVDGVDSSTVCVNASTRFADGGELGLGAEIGISTMRLHAYGPMGAEELTTTKFVVMGSGQVRT